MILSKAAMQGRDAALRPGHESCRETREDRHCALSQSPRIFAFTTRAKGPIMPAPLPALIVVDVQRAFDEWEAAGQRRNNPDAVARIAGLLKTFRARGAPIFHIRHEGTKPSSSFLPSRSGYAVKDEAREQPGETIIVKRVNSAFIGTDLEQRLRAAGIGNLVICGATTNHCVETTTRMAGNLGFDAQLVRDATWTFDRIGARRRQAFRRGDPCDDAVEPQRRVRAHRHQRRRGRLVRGQVMAAMRSMPMMRQ
ncbi:nicotinamidase-related amidase [Bradyrhizobium ottawaense]